jgi:hypothetical protein
MRTPVCDQALEVGEKGSNGALAARTLLIRQRRLEGTEDRQRPRAQGSALLARHGQQIADHLHRHGAG